MPLTTLGLVFISLLFGATANAFADPTPPTPAPNVKMTRVKGEPVRYVLSDGREAQLYFTDQPGIEVSAKIAFSDTSCAIPNPLPACTLYFSVKDIPFEVKWTKNPDSTRVGQVVKIFGENAFKGDATYSPYAQMTDKVNGADLKPLRIECDDFTWMTGTKDSVPKFTLASWSGESMATNPETGIPENQTDVGVYQPLFERVDDRQMVLSSSGSWFATSFIGLRYWFFASDILQFVTLPTATHGSCQYAFKPAFGKARTDLENAYKKLALPSTPYIEGSNGYLDDQLSSNTSFLSNEIPEDQLK